VKKKALLKNLQKMTCNFCLVKGTGGMGKRQKAISKRQKAEGKKQKAISF